MTQLHDRGARRERLHREVTDYVQQPAERFVIGAYKDAGRNLVKTGPDQFDILSQTGTVIAKGVTFRQACERAPK